MFGVAKDNPPQPSVTFIRARTHVYMLEFSVELKVFNMTSGGGVHRKHGVKIEPVNINYAIQRPDRKRLMNFASQTKRN